MRLHPHLPILLTALALLAGACTPGSPQVQLPTAAPTATPTPTPVPTPTPTPAEISARIGRATQSSQSVHFLIELSGEPVYADETGFFAIDSIEGDLQRPDGVAAVVTAGGGSGTSEIRTVSLDGQQYITNPITKAWQCLPAGVAFDPAVLFDPGKGIEYLLQEGLEDVTLAGTETIDGAPHYHLRGTLPGPLLQQISGGRLGAGPVPVDLWADQASMRLSRMTLVDAGSEADEPTTWQITFSDYDAPVDVRVPPNVSCA